MSNKQLQCIYAHYTFHANDARLPQFMWTSCSMLGRLAAHQISVVGCFLCIVFPHQHSTSIASVYLWSVALSALPALQSSRLQRMKTYTRGRYFLHGNRGKCILLDQQMMELLQAPLHADSFFVFVWNATKI